MDHTCLKLRGLHMFDYVEQIWEYVKQPADADGKIWKKLDFTQPIKNWLCESNIDLQIGRGQDSQYVYVYGKTSDLLLFQMRWLVMKSWENDR